ncbi:lactate racemase domain-containing protein [Oceanobacillus senegalensis]|uniref:lactate racemase domain-containing protein n=1 Tax=Oceanobacillus senegalensis TaxID=1936063 RepID=UPI0015C43CB3|nr:lactate racemase domain-containing protein [Oceanobacillus senegalensis]
MDRYPKMVKIRQHFDNRKIDDVKAELSSQLSQDHIRHRLHQGDKVAIAVGSRGIDNLVDVVTTVIKHVKERGAFPFLVPAMGSHGGATDKGQEQILRDYGLIPEVIGAPIYSSMEVTQLGTVEKDIPVYFDKSASEADAIIVVNRVKPHTNFKSDIESGILKMMTVGLGKQKGASTIHSHGIYGLKTLIPKMAEVILEKMPISYSIALVENAYDRTAICQVIEPENLIETEKDLLVKAKQLMPSLPTDDLDILLVEEMGKNISGTGMDPNIIGRIYVRGQEEPKKPDINYIGVFDLTMESHGNACGIGYADLTTKRLVDKINYHDTYMNLITAVFPHLAKIPITLSSDKEVVDVALQFMKPKKASDVTIVRVKNTLDLHDIEVSESLWKKIKDISHFEQLRPARDLEFDEGGRIISL